MSGLCQWYKGIWVLTLLVEQPFSYISLSYWAVDHQVSLPVDVFRYPGLKDLDLKLPFIFILIWTLFLKAFSKVKICCFKELLHLFTFWNKHQNIGTVCTKSSKLQADHTESPVSKILFLIWSNCLLILLKQIPTNCRTNEEITVLCVTIVH